MDLDRCQCGHGREVHMHGDKPSWCTNVKIKARYYDEEGIERKESVMASVPEPCDCKEFRLVTRNDAF